MTIVRSSASGYLEVDLGALARNYETLEDAAGDSTVAAVVKADAYGLGMGPIAQRLDQLGCRTFFVATFHEGRALRAALGQSEIYVFEGVARGREQDFVELALRPVLNTPEQARCWLPLHRPCALHVDTGMNRLGMSASDAQRLLGALDSEQTRQIELVMTHLACAEQPEHPLNRKQVERFIAVASRLPEARTSIANSAGVFLGSAFRGDLVRPGIALYGGNPFDDRDSPVDVVARLYARVLQLRDVDADSTVGYGATHAAARGDRLAVVGAGYADGFPRQLGNRGFASVAGVRVPIVGRISMDVLCLDVSGLPRDAIEVDQYVELFGREITVEEVALSCGTISYEILTGLSPRLERVYVD